MLILNRFEIENFKSYKGKHILGPFKKFTAIVGPNGCGKSNLMDAISFVLGEKINNLRVTKLKDLIHGSHLNKSICNFSSVALYISDETQVEHCLCRKISDNGEYYYLNDNQVSKKEYNDFLQVHGIYIKLKNFMVFQGDIESVIHKGSKDLRLIFEKFSGSDKLVSRYNECHSNLKMEMENFTSTFKKRRDAVTEKKKLDLEKEEANKYNELEKNIDESKKDVLLLQLMLIDKTLISLKNSYNECKNSILEKSCELEHGHSTYAQMKNNTCTQFHDMSVVEKRINDRETQVKELKPQYNNVKNKILYIEQKINEQRKSLERASKSHQKHVLEIDNLNRDLKDAERLLASLSQENADSSAPSIDVLSSQYEEYTTLKNKAVESTKATKDQLHTLNQERENYYKEIAKIKSTIQELEARKSVLNDNQQDISLRSEKVKKTNENLLTLLNAKRTKLKDLRENINLAKERKKTLINSIETINDSMSLYKLDQLEITKRRRLHEIDEKLRLHFTGVYGLLSDLIDPVHRRYAISITKTLGRNMDSIVVDDHKIAFDCIEYLKEQQLGRAAFLPIKGLKIKSIDEKNRYLGGTSKLMIDVVRFDNPDIKKVVQFVFGNTIVCDSIEEAHKIAFGQEIRRKTVSLDGTLFLKNGIISGGSISLNKKALCWDEKYFVNLKSERADVVQSIKDVNLMIEKEIFCDDLSVEIKDLELQYNNSVSEYSHIENIIKSNIKKDLDNLNAKISNLKDQIDGLKQLADGISPSIDKLTNEINETTENIFRSFCNKYDIINHEYYEGTSFKEINALSEKRLNCESNINLLRNQLKYELSKDLFSKRNNIETQLKQDEKELEELKKIQDESLKKIEECTDEIHQLKKQNSSLQQKLNLQNSTLKELTKNINNFEKTELQLKQNLSSIEFRMDNVIGQKHSILKSSQIKNLSITLSSGSIEDLNDFTLQSQRTQMENDSKSVNQSEKNYNDILNMMEINYSYLSESFKNIHDEDEIKESIEKLNNKIEEFQNKLIQSTPNLKILDIYNEKVDEITKISSSFEEIKLRVRNIQKEFDSVKKERYNLFMKTYDSAATKIDEIYKLICNDQNAQAFLTIDDSEEPYLSGISYNCVAPKKRYQSIDQLSGGEKVLAALALLFALHSAHPAPFFIFDEIDAALDYDNIINVANFIIQSSTKNLSFIVISLKEELYAKADALVGVTHDPNCEITSSKIFTIDLDKYD